MTKSRSHNTSHKTPSANRAVDASNPLAIALLLAMALVVGLSILAHQTAKKVLPPARSVTNQLVPTVWAPPTVDRRITTERFSPQVFVASSNAYDPADVSRIYRPNGTFSGWVGPAGSLPPNIRSLPDLSQGLAPVSGENGTRYGDISPLTGRPKTVYVNGYSRSDGTYVSSHWRSPPGASASGPSAYNSSGVAGNGSYYGQISSQTGLPKTTYVRSYTRRDGTYVQAHYRSR